MRGVWWMCSFFAFIFTTTYLLSYVPRPAVADTCGITQGVRSADSRGGAPTCIFWPPGLPLDFCGTPPRFDGTECANKTIGATLVLQQHLLPDVLHTMDILFQYPRTGLLPLNRSGASYIIRNSDEYAAFMAFCSTAVVNNTPPILLHATVRARSPFFLEDRALCDRESPASRFLQPYCTAHLPLPIAGWGYTEPIGAPFYVNISRACVRGNGVIYRRPHDEPLNALLHYGCSESVAAVDPDDPRELDVPVVALAATWSSAYYHWVGESLPRGAAVGDFCTAHTGNARDAFAAMVPAVYGAHVETVRGDVCAPHVIWPAPATCGHGIPALANTFRERARVREFHGVGRTIVYMHREQGAVRHFVQFQQLVDFLSVDSSVQVVVFSGENPRAVFARADCVVGPHGAGFSNLLFARPGIPVVEILYGNETSVGFLPFSLSLGMEWHGFVAEGDRDSDLRFSDAALRHFLTRVRDICS